TRARSPASSPTTGSSARRLHERGATGLAEHRRGGDRCFGRGGGGAVAAAPEAAGRVQRLVLRRSTRSPRATEPVVRAFRRALCRLREGSRGQGARGAGYGVLRAVGLSSADRTGPGGGGGPGRTRTRRSQPGRSRPDACARQ